jgi:thiamine-monophosphate kinase
MGKKSAEFTLIDRYFRGLTDQDGVIIGVGDDGAIIGSDPLSQIVVATDTLVESTHFPVTAEARQIATRALSVNLSDMAAMGALPKWFTLALTLPNEFTSESWLQSFSSGLAQIAAQHSIALIGGDTTAGPLTISITMLGEVPAQGALLRSGAQSGDCIYVSGTLGDGAAALDMIDSENSKFPQNQRLLTHFYCPQPQVELGLGLRNFASACIDISDGLVADLGHLCEASQVNADIYAAKLPVHSDLKQLPERQYIQWALSGGDDYQLCFTVPEAQQKPFEVWAGEKKIPITAIGKMSTIDSQPLVRVDGQPAELATGGYSHFN